MVEDFLKFMYGLYINKEELEDYKTKMFLEKSFGNPSFSECMRYAYIYKLEFCSHSGWSILWKFSIIYAWIFMTDWLILICVLRISLSPSPVLLKALHITVTASSKIFGTSSSMGQSHRA